MKNVFFAAVCLCGVVLGEAFLLKAAPAGLAPAPAGGTFVLGCFRRRLIG